MRTRRRRGSSLAAAAKCGGAERSRRGNMRWRQQLFLPPNCICSMTSTSEDVTVTIRTSSPNSEPEIKATMNIPVAHLYHYARRPEEWLRAVCTWSAGIGGIFESSMDDETYTPVVFPSQCSPICRFYRFTALDEGTGLIELVRLVITHSS